MKKGLLGLALLAGLSSVSRNASAEAALPNAGALEDVLTTVMLSALDTGMTAIDVSFALDHTWAPVPYAAIEFMAGTGQFGHFLDSALSTGAGTDPTRSVVWATLGAAFMAHAVVTLVGRGSHHEAPPPPAPVTVAPLALSDAARTSVPGLAVLGRF